MNGAVGTSGSGLLGSVVLRQIREDVLEVLFAAGGAAIDHQLDDILPVPFGSARGDGLSTE